MSKNRQIRRRRTALFHQQNGRCHWCDQPMTLRNFKPRRGQRPPGNQCTLDHLRDRFHPLRQEPACGEQRYVAACWECNARRGRESEQAQGVEILQIRSGRHGGGVTIRAPQFGIGA